MKANLALLKTTLNNHFGWSWMRLTYLRQHKRLWEPLLILFVLVTSGPALLYVYIRFLNLLFDQGMSMGQPEIVLTLAILAAQMMVVLFGFFWLISTFYFSKDLPQLVPLPLTPQAVLGAKFCQIILSELLTALFIAGPAIVVYAVRAGAGLPYWLAAVPTFLLLPVIPLAITGVLVVLAMRVINVRRSRDLLTIIAGVFGLVFLIAYQYLAAKLQTGSEGELARRSMDIVASIGKRFPPSIWSTHALAGASTWAGWLQFALLLAVSLALLALMLYAAHALFYRGLLAGSGMTAKKARFTSADLEAAGSRDAVSALFSREWRLLLRTPIFLLQWLTSALLVPILFLLGYFTQGKTFALAQLFRLISAPAKVLAGAALIGFCSVMVQLAATAFSREGKLFWVNKVIPVDAAAQIKAKQRQIWAATLLSLLPTCACLVFALGFRADLLIPCLILGLLAVYPMQNMGLILDILHPKLVWTNPQQAMKSNFNVIIAMLLSVLFFSVLGILAAIILGVHWPLYGVYLLLGILLLALGALLERLLYALAPRRYREIEV